MRIRHATFRLGPDVLARMVSSKEAAVAVLEALAGMQIAVSYGAVEVGRLQGKDVAAEVTGAAVKRPYLNLPLPDGEIDLAQVMFHVRAAQPLPGFMDVVFEVVEPRRAAGGGWCGAVTGERTYPITTAVEA